jgi:hypothetical protein
MKSFISAEDIEAIAERGQGQLIIQAGMVLTDLARRTADSLGVKLVEQGRQAAPAATPASFANHPVSMGNQFSGKPKGCQGHGGAASAATAPTANGGAASPLADQLVAVIKKRGHQS